MARKSVSEHHAILIADTARYEAGMKQAVAATSAAQTSISRGSAAMQQKLQQAGYQVQDFFVQVAGGQGVLRAFGQQAPQFLGALGAGGALAGAAITIGVLAAQMLGVGKTTKETTAEVSALDKALRNLYLARSQAKFESLAPEGKIGSLNMDKGQIEADIRDYKKSIDSINSKIAGITTASPTGAFAIDFGKNDEYESLIKDRDAFQTRIATSEKELTQLAKQRGDIEKKIAEDRATEEEKSRKSQIKMIQEAQRGRIALTDQLQSSLVKVRDRVQSDLNEQLKRDVADLISELYTSETTERKSIQRPMLDIPVNDYQRRGLSLSANGGAAGGPLNEQKQTNKYLSEIARDLAAARRDGVISWSN